MSSWNVRDPEELEKFAALRAQVAEYLAAAEALPRVDGCDGRGDTSNHRLGVRGHPPEDCRGPRQAPGYESSPKQNRLRRNFLHAVDAQHSAATQLRQALHDYQGDDSGDANFFSRTRWDLPATSLSTSIDRRASIGRWGQHQLLVGVNQIRVTGGDATLVGCDDA